MRKFILILILVLMVFTSMAWSGETPKNFGVKLEYYPSVFHSASDGVFSINNGFRWQLDYKFCRDNWRAYVTSTTGTGNSHQMNVQLQDTVLGLNRKLGQDCNFNLGYKWFSTQTSFYNLNCSGTFSGLGFGANWDPASLPLFAEVNYYPSLNGPAFYLNDLEYNFGLKMRGPVEVGLGYRGQNFVSSPGGVTNWRGAYFNIGTKF